MQQLILALIVGTLLAFTSPTHAVPVFAKGADIGWLSEMETKGTKFYDRTGKETACLQILQDYGINSIRLRVWVNPARGWCGKDDVVTMARRVHAMGFRLMIDFHYSDTWADPQKQPIPKAWEGHSTAQLAQDVYDHTFEVLSAIKAAGVTPEWVQVGNEITFGTLWPEAKLNGKEGDFARLVPILNRGYDAVKAVDKKMQVIIHLNDGASNERFTKWFDAAVKEGLRYDIIGLSFYPEPKGWQHEVDRCIANMTDLASRYHKGVMVCEIGYYAKEPEVGKEILTQIIHKTEAIPNHKGLGVFYWEPEGFTQKYNRNAWQEDGKPTVMMEAFQSH